VDGLGRPLKEHSVTIELRFLRAHSETEARRQISQYLVNRGWRYRMHQARHAMERFICRPCLRQVTEMQRDWERKAQNEKRDNVEDYYQLICGD
jgi:hypothetical protein